MPLNPLTTEHFSPNIYTSLSNAVHNKCNMSEASSQIQWLLMSTLGTDHLMLEQPRLPVLVFTIYMHIRWYSLKSVLVE